MMRRAAGLRSAGRAGFAAARVTAAPRGTRVAVARPQPPAAASVSQKRAISSSLL